MADLIQPAQVLGSRYSITIEHTAAAGCVATMTARGRKTTWAGYGKTPEAAKADVLRYLDSQLHPFVNVKIAAT